MTQDDDELHRQRMTRQKEAFEERKAKATREKGLLIVHTGAGKGKTTAALGLAFRALGQGMKVGVVQFIKGAIPTGEAALAPRLAGFGLELHTMGDGFTWNTQDRDKDMHGIVELMKAANVRVPTETGRKKAKPHQRAWHALKRVFINRCRDAGQRRSSGAAKRRRRAILGRTAAHRREQRFDRRDTRPDERGKFDRGPADERLAQSTQ